MENFNNLDSLQQHVRHKFEQARLLDINQDYEKSIDLYTSVLEIEPTFALAFNNRGSVYRKTKNYDKAIQDLSLAIKYNPELSDAYNNRAVTYREMGEYERALKDIEQTIILDEKALNDHSIQPGLKKRLAISFYNKAIIYYFLKNKSQFLIACQESLKLEPKLAEKVEQLKEHFRELFTENS